MNRVTGFLATGLLAILAPLAQANIEISYQIGATTGNCGAGTATLLACAPFTVNGVTVTGLSGFSNSPGGFVAQQFGSTINISNTGSSTIAVQFWIASDGFTSPVTPPAITFASSLTTDSTLGSGTSDLTSCVDTPNVGVPFGSPVVSPFCAGATHYSLANSQQAFASASSSNQTITMSIPTLSAPYTLSQHITLSLSAGASVHVNTSDVLTSVPEPMSISLLGGVLLLVGRQLRRKRS